MLKVKIDDRVVLIDNSAPQEGRGFTIFCNKVWRLEAYRPGVRATISCPSENIYTSVDLKEIVLPVVFNTFTFERLFDVDFRISLAKRLDAHELMDACGTEWFDTITEASGDDINEVLYAEKKLLDESLSKVLRSTDRK